MALFSLNNLGRVLAAVLVLSVVRTAALASDDTLPGFQVVAKTTGAAVVIWDASPLVAQIVQAKTPDDKASLQIELLATKLLVSKAKTLPKANTLTVNVIYLRTGDVSPVYKAATLSGAEHLLNVTASRADAIKNAAEWAKSVDGGALPHGVTATVTGKYPH